MEASARPFELAPRRNNELYTVLDGELVKNSKD